MNTYKKYSLELCIEEIHESKEEYQVESVNDAYAFFKDVCRLNKKAEEDFLEIALNSKGKIIFIQATLPLPL
ncbi:MAG: hypothetical protein RSA49_03655 [Anaerovoracaceae bacterium]